MNIANPERIEPKSWWQVSENLQFYHDIFDGINGCEILPLYSTEKSEGQNFVHNCFLAIRYKGVIYNVVRKHYNVNSVQLFLADTELTNLDYQTEQKIKAFEEKNKPQYMGKATEKKLDAWAKYLAEREKIANEGNAIQIFKCDNKIAEIKKIFGEKIQWYTNNTECHTYIGRVDNNIINFKFNISPKNGISTETTISSYSLTLEKIAELMAITE